MAVKTRRHGAVCMRGANGVIVIKTKRALRRGIPAEKAATDLRPHRANPGCRCGHAGPASSPADDELSHAPPLLILPRSPSDNGFRRTGGSAPLAAAWLNEVNDRIGRHVAHSVLSVKAKLSRMIGQHRSRRRRDATVTARVFREWRCLQRRLPRVVEVLVDHRLWRTTWLRYFASQTLMNPSARAIAGRTPRRTA